MVHGNNNINILQNQKVLNHRGFGQKNISRDSEMKKTFIFNSDVSDCFRNELLLQNLE